MLTVSSLLYGITVTPSAAYMGGKSATSVAYAMLKSKGFPSTIEYIGGDTTAADHLLKANWGHGSFFRALAKCALSLQRLKKFGLGSRLGELPRSAMTVSYSMMVSILFSWF